MVRARWRANPGFRPKLSDIIAQAPPAVARAGNAALRTNGEEAKTLIRTAAPKDQGALEESIDWKFGDPPPGTLAVGRARPIPGVPEHLRITIYAGGKKAPHAHLVHFGTAQRFTDDGKYTGAAPAQPFFFPIIRALRRRMLNRIRRQTRQALKEALR